MKGSAFFYIAVHFALVYVYISVYCKACGCTGWRVHLNCTWFFNLNPLERVVMRVGRLKKVVQEIIDPLKCGGRVVQSGKGDEKVFVYDLHTWPHEYTALILNEFPNLEMKVQGSTQSLSGFVVILQVCRPSNLFLRLRIILVVCIAILLFVALRHRPLQQIIL